MNFITSTRSSGGTWIILLLLYTTAASQSIQYRDIAAVANIDSLEKSLTPENPEVYLRQLLTLERSRTKPINDYRGFGKYLKDIEKLAKELGKQEEIAPIYQILMGQSMVLKRNYQAAAKSYQAARNGFITKADTSGQITASSFLARLYLDQVATELRNVDAGLAYVKEVTALAEQYGNKELILLSLNLKLASYMVRPAAANLDEVQKLGQQIIALVGDDPGLQTNKLAVINALAIQYEISGKPMQAYATFKAFLALPEVRQEPAMHARALLNLGLMCIKIERYDEGESYYNQILELPANEPNKMYRVDAFEGLKIIYTKQGNYQEAIAFADSASRLQTEIYKAENTTKLNELEATYQNKEITAKNTALANENELVKSRNRAILFGLLAATLLTLLLTATLVFLYRSRKATQLQIAEVNRLSQVRDLYVDIIAHDLRSPILAMQGLYDLVSTSLKSKRYEEVERIAAYIDAATLKTRTLLDNLFHWGLTQRETVPYRPEVLHVVDEISEIRDIYTAVRANQTFDVRLVCPDNLRIFADHDGFQLILRNLLDNAVKHLPPNGGFVEITAGMLDNATTEIRIQDNGKGISKEKLDQINYVFTHPEQIQLGYEGLGLGTILVGKFVRKNKGVVLAQTNETGSLVTVSLPVAP